MLREMKLNSRVFFSVIGIRSETGEHIGACGSCAVPLGAVSKAIKVVKKEGIEHTDPLIITQASSLGLASKTVGSLEILRAGLLLVDSSYVDIFISICRSPEFPGDELFGEISGVMKPGGMILIHLTSQSATGNMTTSSVERKLLLAGFLDVQVVLMTQVVPSEVVQSFGITTKKPSWKIGSSFIIKKASTNLPKVHIDDDVDLIDEDSLLTEEDLKKPQLLPVGDCEVGSTRKACKNCTCGRPEEEKKAEKLGLTILNQLVAVVDWVMLFGAVHVHTRVFLHLNWVRRLLYLGIFWLRMSKYKKFKLDVMSLF
ncbi:unnamed protein product [Ilex paraguariensis]|uniref:Anamorsin homolog n=1 Tax=Ilex paraguariensis TaxID=185542 RepID=A0ABC8SB52_9AQUA